MASVGPSGGEACSTVTARISTSQRRPDTDTRTLFEKIADGDIPADFVHRDDEIIAFRDINPAAPVHVLIVPIKPIPTVNDMAPEDVPLLGRMVSVARDIAGHPRAGSGRRLRRRVFRGKLFRWRGKQ